MNCPTRLVDRYDVLIFDVCLTLMFGVDRFGEEEDFAATYRRYGGRLHDEATVRRWVRALWNRMLADYRNPARYEDCPTFEEYLEGFEETRRLPQSEKEILADVFGHHECGRVPDDHAEAVKKLARTHRVAVVSNISSPPAHFHAELERVGIRSLFETVVFSCEHRILKPSPRLFLVATERMGVRPERCLYVGDNPKRDVVGARAAGMPVAWVNTGGRPRDPAYPEPDHEIRSVVELCGEG